MFTYVFPPLDRGQRTALQLGMCDDRCGPKGRRGRSAKQIGHDHPAQTVSSILILKWTILNRIRRYFLLNPARWEGDLNNPRAIETTDGLAWVQIPDTTRSPMPHTYDSLSVGDDFSWSRTLTMDDVRAFADITGDDNPLHIDADYAAGTRFGKPVVHGVYILGLASKVLGRDFPGHGSIAVSLQAKFLRPVPVGEEVTIQVKVAEKIEKHRHVKMRLFAYVGGKMAVGGEALVIPPEENGGE